MAGSDTLSQRNFRSLPGSATGSEQRSRNIPPPAGTQNLPSTAGSGPGSDHPSATMPPPPSVIGSEHPSQNLPPPSVELSVDSAAQRAILKRKLEEENYGEGNLDDPHLLVAQFLRMHVSLSFPPLSYIASLRRELQGYDNKQVYEDVLTDVMKAQKALNEVTKKHLEVVEDHIAKFENLVDAKMKAIAVDKQAVSAIRAQLSLKEAQDKEKVAKMVSEGGKSIALSNYIISNLSQRYQSSSPSPINTTCPLRAPPPAPATPSVA